jgi:hypothetical protein
VVLTGSGGAATATAKYTYEQPVPVPVPAPEAAVARGTTLVAHGGTDKVTDIVAGTVQRLTYTFSNSGKASLTTSDARFEVMTNCNATLQPLPGEKIDPGKQSSMTVEITPAKAGEWSAKVSVTTNDPKKKLYTWTISGRATAKPVPVPAPKITSLAPISGTAAGGTTVTITGTDLNGTSSVTFDGTEATSVRVVDSKSVTCVAPAHAAGPVKVELTVTGVTATATGDYTYTASVPVPAPKITNLTPISGTAAGGTTVTITGTDLNGTSSVTFGGTPATSVTVVSAASVTCVAPAHAAGAVDVVLTAPGGAATSTGGYTYRVEDSAPAITTQPSDQSVTVGQTATFTVVATGVPAPAFQWYKNKTAISGATSASYTTPMTEIGDNGAQFSVRATNSVSVKGVDSENATLTVIADRLTPNSSESAKGGGCGIGGLAGVVLASLGLGIRRGRQARTQDL